MYLDTLRKQLGQPASATRTPDRERLLTQLRANLSPREQRMFGIEIVEAKNRALLSVTNLLSGLGASATTAALFLVVGFLATLGLPEGSLVAAAGTAVNA